MINAMPALSLLSFVIALSLLQCLAGNRQLPCHCADDSECHDNGYCPLGCASGWYGPGCQVGNYALKKTAHHRSNFREEYSAAMAVDGRDEGKSSFEYCAVATPDKAQISWWYVELDNHQDIVIHDVTLKGSSGERLTNFSIVYTSVAESHTPNVNWSTCIYNRGPPPLRKSTYKCQGYAVAKKVGILRKRDRSDPLALCEVIVNGYSKLNCSNGFTGPGCLLRDCKTSHCSGGCSKYGGCISPTCPDPSFLPPDCWIRLPSLRTLTFAPSATCDTINITINSFVSGGDLSISSILIELKSDDQLLLNTIVTLKENYMEAIVPVPSGRTFNVRLIPQWCNGRFGQCFNGVSTNWTNVTTAVRDYITITQNDKEDPSLTMVAMAYISGLLIGGILVMAIFLILRRRRKTKTAVSKDDHICFEPRAAAEKKATHVYISLNPETMTRDDQHYTQLNVTPILHSQEEEQPS